MINKAKKFPEVMLAAAVLLGCLVGVEAHAALLPVNLRCALRVNPQGIEDVTGLSWIRHSGQTAQGGIRQSSLRKRIVLPAGQTIDGLFTGQSYLLQSTTNLTSNSWSTETNFVATEATISFTNSVTNDPQTFYRIVSN